MAKDMYQKRKERQENKTNTSYNEKITNINWYPGHMTKARRMIEDNLKLIDVFIELLDARAVFSSENPDIAKMGQNKYRMIILNKSDLADGEVNKKFVDYFNNANTAVICLDSRNRKSVLSIKNEIISLCSDKIERDRKRGIINRPIRAMVLGIPNVGKSTFINSFVGKSCTKTGNKPGVTKGKQWIRIDKNIELLDTPGILWPKFEDMRTGINLAMIGSINDDVVQLEELSLLLIDFLKLKYPSLLENMYDINRDSDSTSIFTKIAERKNCLKTGGEFDYTKTSKLFLDDFRTGRLGKISLEFPHDTL